MDEHGDVSMGNVSESRVAVSVDVADETLVENMGFQGKVEGGSLSEGVVEEVGACNGEDIMVEVLGSDVFVDGVCTHGGGANSNEEVVRGGLVEASLEREVKFVDGGGGGGDGDLASREVGVLDDEARNPGIESGIEGSLTVSRSMGGETQVVVVEEVVEMVNEEGMEGGTGSVDSVGRVHGDLTEQKVGILDGEVWNPGIETAVICSTEVVESSSVQTQVVVEEAADAVNEVGLNKKNEVPARDALEGIVSCSEKDQILTVESVCEGAEKDGGVFANPESLDGEMQVSGSLCCSLEVQKLKVEMVGGFTENHGAVCADLISSCEPTQVVVGGEAAAVSDKVFQNPIIEVPKTVSLGGASSCSKNDHNLKVELGRENMGIDNQVTDRGEIAAKDNGEVSNSKIEVLEPVSLDRNMCFTEKDQQLKVEAVGGIIGKHGVACADSESSVEQTQVDGADSAAINDRVLIWDAGVPKTDALDEIVSYSENNQNLMVETACGSSRKEGIVHADSKCSDERTLITEEEALETKNEVLNSNSEVLESDALDKNLSCSARDQELKVVTAGGSAENGAAVSSGELTHVIGSGVAAIHNNEVSNPKVEVPNTVSLDGISTFSESDKNLKVETAREGTVNVGIVLADSEASDEQSRVADGGEVAAMDVKESLNEDEVPCSVALDENLCSSVKVQELKVEIVGGSTEKSVVCADMKSSGEHTQIAVVGDVAAVDNKEVSNLKNEVPKIDAADGILSCSENVVYADPESTGEHIRDVVGEAAGIGSETVMDVIKTDALDGDLSFSNNQNSTVDTDDSSEKDGILKTNLEPLFEGFQIVGGGEVAAMDSEEVLDSKAEVMGNDVVVQADSELSRVQNLVVEGNFAVMDSKRISYSKVEVPGCDALDGNLSLSETDQELKVETVGGSAKRNGGVHVDPSSGVESSPIEDLTTMSDTLEENTSMQDEKSQTVVQPAETFTVEVDGDQSMNSFTVEEISNQGTCVTAISDFGVEVAVGSQAALNSASSHDEGDSVSSYITYTVSPLPDENQDPKVQVVINHDSLPDGDQTMGNCVSNSVISDEVENQAVGAKDESCKVDKKHIMATDFPKAKVSQSGDNESIVGSLVVSLETCPGKVGNSQGEVCKEIISLPDDSHHEGGEVQGTGGKVGCPALEYIEESAACDLTQVGSNVGQEIEVEEQVTDAEHIGLHGGQEIEAEEHVTDAEQIGLHGGQELEAEEQVTDTEQLKTIEEEKIVKRAGLKPGSLVRVHQASYQLPPENEGEFSVSDLVWGKVRSHPWWPGQIFDPSDSSEKAMKYHKKDCFLVAYFGDRTFAWNEASLLKSFRTHFSLIEKQNNSEAIHNAVNCALEEVSRRVELGLACSCIPKDIYDNIKFQIVENTGIQEESSRRDGVDESTSANSFEPDKFVEYIKALARFPSGGADRLELVIAKSQLLAFCRLNGCSRLPEFQLCGGLLETDADTSLSEDKTHSSEVIEHGTPICEDDEQHLSVKGKLKSQNSSSHKRKHNLKDSVYHKKKERSMSELMGGAMHSPDDENGSDGKTTSKLASSSSGKKRKSGDSFDDDSVVQDRRKTIFSANVSNTTNSSPRQSFKIGECIRRVASQMTGSPSILKCSGERFQKVDGSSDKPAGAVFDVSFQTPEDSQRGKMIIPTEYSSPDEMLSQLHLAARDPMKGYSFLSIIISFFSDFRNSIIPGRYSRRENSSMNKVGSGRKRKASRFVIGSPETFEFEDMKDSYWTDRIIQNGSEEQPSSQNKKGDYQLVTVEPEDSLQVSRRLYSRKKSYAGNHEVAGEKPERKQDLSPTELILNFSEVNSVPSETSLNKMFRRFGPLKESETEVDRETSRARVVFKRCSDAEVAFSSAGKFNIFGPTLVNYELSYSPSVPFKSSPIETTQYLEDAI